MIKAKHAINLLRALNLYEEDRELLYMLAQQHDLTPRDVEMRYKDVKRYWEALIDGKEIKVTPQLEARLMLFTKSFLNMIQVPDWRTPVNHAEKRHQCLVSSELSPQALLKQRNELHDFIDHHLASSQRS